jgi:hypothetical protein
MPPMAWSSGILFPCRIEGRAIEYRQGFLKRIHADLQRSNTKGVSFFKVHWNVWHFRVCGRPPGRPGAPEVHPEEAQAQPEASDAVHDAAADGPGEEVQGPILWNSILAETVLDRFWSYHIFILKLRLKLSGTIEVFNGIKKQQNIKCINWHLTLLKLI